MRIFGLNISRAKPNEDLEAKGLEFLKGDAVAVSPSRHIIFPNINGVETTNSSIVMACVYWAMRNVKAATPFVAQQTEDGTKPVPMHPAGMMLQRPQYKISPEFRKNISGRMMTSLMVFSAMMDGNGYQQIIVNDSGGIIGLDWIPWMFCEPVEVPNSPGLIDYYLVHGQRVERDQMIHFTVGIDPTNQCKGMSPLKSVMRQVMTDNDIAVYSSSIVRAPTPGIVISQKDSMGAPIDQKEADRIATMFSEVSSGQNAGAVMVPTVPVDVSAVGFSPEQLAIDKLNSIPEERITAVLGIPAIVAGMGAGLARSTYNNMSEAREGATEEFLVPFWEDLAECYTNQFLPLFETSLSRMILMDTASVRSLQEDEDAKHDRARSDFNANLITRAEARGKIGEKALPGDEQVYSYMLRPGPMAPSSLPQGPSVAKDARAKAEGA